MTGSRAQIGPPARSWRADECLARSDRYADGLQELVGDRLPFRVPQREQVTDVADGAVDGVGDLPHDRHAEADRLSRRLTDDLELQDRLADARPGLALPQAVIPDREGKAEQRGDGEDRPCQSRRSIVTRSAEFTEIELGIICETDRFDLLHGHQADHPDPGQQRDRNVVDEPCQGTRHPRRVLIWRPRRAGTGRWRRRREATLRRWWRRKATRRRWWRRKATRRWRIVSGRRWIGHCLPFLSSETQSIYGVSGATCPPLSLR